MEYIEDAHNVQLEKSSADSDDLSIAFHRIITARNYFFRRELKQYMKLDFLINFWLS